jgi:hypothetical protein
MIIQMIRFLRIVGPFIARRSLSPRAQSTNLASSERQNYFAHLIQVEDRLDLISFLKDILILSPESDERSREETFLSLSPD